MNDINLDILKNLDFESKSDIIKLNPSNLIIDSWQQKQQFIQISRDYSEINKLEAINSQNRVNLVVPLLTATKDWIFPLLNKALLLIKNLEVDKIILHLVSDTQVLDLWQSFVSEYSATLESLTGKFVLGSISDHSYALNSDQDPVKLALALRVIIDPKVASLDDSGETIDGYFKSRFNSRYYENYDIYTEEDLINFENQSDIKDQLQQILQKSYNQIIFPVDIRTNSLQKYDLIWYLDGPLAIFNDLISFHLDLNLEYNLNQSILSNFNYNLTDIRSKESKIHYYSVLDIKV